MKIANGIIAAALVFVSGNSFAENYFCISDQGKPRHCNGGDIIMVKPTMVPRVCDFTQQILRMPKGENQADYLCRYTGTIMAVKELKSRTVTPPPKAITPPKKNNTMFNNMPFFK